jgi:hypothetical protein
MALAPEDQIEVPPEVVSSIKSLDTQVAQLTQALRQNAASGANGPRHGPYVRLDGAFAWQCAQPHRSTS